MPREGGGGGWAQVKEGECGRGSSGLGTSDRDRGNSLVR